MFNTWESHRPKIYKINLIKTMINKFKIICSNESLFNKDLKQLKESFLWSGYPTYIIDKHFNICIKQKRTNLQNCSLNVPRKQIYFGFQYINKSSVQFVQNISKLISKNFNYIKVYFVLQKRKKSSLVLLIKN